MTQSVLHDLDVHTRFAHSCGECMPQGVTAKVRKQNGVIFTLLEHFVAAIPDDPADGLVQRSLIKCSSIPVEEDKIRVTVDGHLALQSNELLVLALHKECFFHKSQHRHLRLTSFRLGGVDIEVASGLTVFIPVIAVDQGVVDVDNTLIQSISHHRSPANSPTAVRFPPSLRRWDTSDYRQNGFSDN